MNRKHNYTNKHTTITIKQHNDIKTKLNTLEHNNRIRTISLIITYLFKQVNKIINIINQ